MPERPTQFSISIPLTEELLTQPFGNFRLMCLTTICRECATFCEVEESTLNVTRVEVKQKIMPLREFADVTIWLAW